mgnify:CR=1 FL=1
MRKAVIIVAILMIFMVSIVADADGLTWESVFLNPDVEFEQMHTTAYCLNGITASGGTTRPGIAACNPRIGQIAVIYTVDGEYLTTVEITDAGSNERLERGTSIDVWFSTLEECQDWMSKTGGEIYVQWIQGEG